MCLVEWAVQRHERPLIPMRRRMPRWSLSALQLIGPVSRTSFMLVYFTKIWSSWEGPPVQKWYAVLYARACPPLAVLRKNAVAAQSPFAPREVVSSYILPLNAMLAADAIASGAPGAV